MTFNTEIVGCYWNEDTGLWIVKMNQRVPGTSEVKQVVETCDLLLHATGILNNFKWPDIEGLNSFKGKVVRKCLKTLDTSPMPDQPRYCTMAQRLSKRTMEG